MQARMFWRLKSGLVALGVWTLIIGIFLAYAKGLPSTPRQSATLLVASLGGAIGSLLIIWLMSMLQVYFSSNTRAGITGVHDFELREDGLFESTGANETLTKWSAVKSVTRYGKFIYVEVGPALFHVIPRTAFGSDTEFEKCLSELKRRSGNDV